MGEDFVATLVACLLLDILCLAAIIIVQEFIRWLRLRAGDETSDSNATAEVIGFRTEEGAAAVNTATPEITTTRSDLDARKQKLNRS